MKVLPKLNINFSPETCDEGSLVFAKNMKVDTDGFLVSDYGYKNISALESYDIVGHIVGLDNKIYFFTRDSKILEYDELSETVVRIQCAWTYSGGQITGCVTTNTTSEKILTIAESLNTGEVLTIKTVSGEGEIVSGDADVINPDDTTATYDVIIDGTVTNNTLNIDTDTTEVVAEPVQSSGSIEIIDNTVNTVASTNVAVTTTVNNNKKIPLKHINLSHCSYDDDESIYTQAPIVPIANMQLIGRYNETIPNGVYVFFIRYKIRSNVYTNWQLCSNPMFAGTAMTNDTLQGSVKYVNTHKDSSQSFILNIKFLDNTNYSDRYSAFQLAFVLSHDEETVARQWREFDINTSTIYFDYRNEDIANIDIEDVLTPIYELYNVKNVVSFKNKLYIGNYVESDLNPTTAQSAVKAISVGAKVVPFQKVDPDALVYNGVPVIDDRSEYHFYRIQNKFDANDSRLTYTVIQQGGAVSGSTTESDVEFHLHYKADKQDPDTINVERITNHLTNNLLFGTDDSIGRTGDPIPHVVTEKVGFSEWKITVNAKDKHPWTDKQLPFVFGKSSMEGLQHLQGYNTIIVSDTGFTDADYTSVKTTIKNAIKVKSGAGLTAAFANAQSTTIDIIPNKTSDNTYIPTNINLAKTDITVANLQNRIIQYVKEQLVNMVVGFSDNQNPQLVLYKQGDTNEYIFSDSITVQYVHYDFDVDIQETGTSNKEFEATCNIKTKRTIYTFNCTVNGVGNVFNPVNTEKLYNEYPQTLMPFSKYRFYAHFVDSKGVITNGVQIGQDIKTSYIGENDIVNLTYSVAEANTYGYKAFFISIKNIGAKIIQGVYDKSAGFNKLFSVELDSLLYTGYEHLKIIDKNGNVITEDASYYSSNYYKEDAVSPTTSPTMNAFGNTGYVSWDGALVSDDDLPLYIKLGSDDDNIDDNAITNLIKATEYIPFVVAQNKDVEIPFYNSYLCEVYKPTIADSVYVAGTEYYTKRVDASGIKLEEPTSFNMSGTAPANIKSSFNLNYLSLTEDLQANLYKYTLNNISQKTVGIALNSLSLSSIYELKNMYRSFTNKYFARWDTNNKVNFETTLRVSNTLSDETYNNSIFKFRAVDYFNIPANRGIIVNVISIADSLLVHTEHSLYKFDTNESIVTTENEVSLKESDPFDKGITQIFDSQYGYAGLLNKSAAVVTYDLYMFYDGNSKRLFAYGGNSQISTIDDTIQGLLRHYNPVICRTLHDEINNRVLFEFESNITPNVKTVAKTFTLSYNYKTRTFVALHDLTLINAFSGRHFAYSYCGTPIRLFDTSNRIDNRLINDYFSTWNIYGAASTKTLLTFDTEDGHTETSPFMLSLIIFPTTSNHETIDSIKYSGDIISEVEQKLNNEDLNIENTYINSRTNPVQLFYITTDSCKSTDVNTTIDDSIRPNDLLHYKGFKYDLGYWQSNYFRNKFDVDNVYDYPDQPNAGGVPNSDNYSLVYGKYFILTFYFRSDKAIKFKDIFINSNRY